MAGTPFTPDKFEESKEYHMKHIALEAGRSGAVLLGRRDRLDLGLSRQRRNAPGLQPCENPKKQIKEADPLPDKLRERIHRSSMVQWSTKGCKMLDKAVELRPDYADAMAYKACCFARRRTCLTPPRAPRSKSRPTTCWTR